MTQDILDELRKRASLHRGGGYPTDFYERVIAEIESLRATIADLTKMHQAPVPGTAADTSEEEKP